ncbi:ClbS/DfsB family four-helix bundle protein [uncultured Roseobacter sp.]|uniref:ClbS/DfsB family four-helix bundle protein n=1 Tax=uncultured Roseobacter sp. TaxID=114847 RepID=UPI00261E7EFA|nr:ClbS/DfsB family four-helix bundle protein [uncultured Roseobacter sp.]
MAATTKTQLLEVTQKEYRKLADLIATLDPAMVDVKDAEDTSITDILCHRAHWIDLFLGWYANGQAGKTVWFPAKGYKWNELKRYNADLRARHAGTPWPEAVNRLEQAHGRLVTFMESKTDAALYSQPMKGANNRWTPGRWAEAAGPSHYRSAAKVIRARLRAARASECGELR